ncbi:alpha/beta hydrolase [Rhizobium sp. BK376]|uniref:alpha/beta hydrolase n=1 Tax=Rhizobium sp. BK376 TaxID=2512149 RepID=UPI001FE13E8F|nr:alpha/beta hydrolase [Rhizobium sp. BK376]
MSALYVVLAMSSATAEDAQQTPKSKEQVEKLVGLFHQHFDGAHSLTERRTAFRKLMDAAPEPSRVQIRHIDADGVEGEMLWPARLHYPIGTRAILYIHGGGFYSGSPETHRAIAGSLAKAASADVFLIDYRLMPDYVYPTQIDDALTVFRWLLQSGYRSENIVIVGDAAGGNIALEATLRQMRAMRPLPAGVVAMSPLTDLAETGNSMKENANSDPVVGKPQLEAVRKAYLGKMSPTDPDASPLYADLKGFPPLLLQVGSRETLLDDTLRFAAKAREAGVDVTSEVWPGMIHQWQLFPFWLDDARRSNQRIAEFAMKHFADQPQE